MKALLIGAVILLAVITLSFVLLQYYYGPHVPTRAVVTMDLLIDAKTMPEGWTLTYGPGKAYEEPAAIDSSKIQFNSDFDPQSRGASQEVYRFAYVRVARNVYQDLATQAGATPPQWTFHSSLADQSQFVCYDYEGREPYPVCSWTARYQEFVVNFGAWLLPSRMTLADMESIVRTIDEWMNFYLIKS